jgi:predicted amidophosphoribosyltransferase
MRHLRKAIVARKPRTDLRRVPGVLHVHCKKGLRNLRPAPSSLSIRKWKWGLRCANGAPPRYAFARARSMAIYEDALGPAVLLLKYRRMEPLGKWFGPRLAGLVLSQRGGVGCGHCGTGTATPGSAEGPRFPSKPRCSPNLPRRPLSCPVSSTYWCVRGSRAAKAGARNRRAVGAVRGAFATRPGSQVDKLRVLLVDDVLTTGATLDACARALLDFGAKSVVAVTIARAARSPVTGPQ